MKLTIAAIAFSAVVAGLAPVAGADTADDMFVSALASQGIVRDRPTVIAAGHAVCDDSARMASTLPGYSRLAAFPDVMNMLGVPINQVVFVISAARAAYCPQYQGM